MTYKEAKRILEDPKVTAGWKKIANNTELIDRGDHFAIKYHSTDIIRMYSDGSYILNANGWHTCSTKARLNHFAPVHIWQHDSEWWLCVPPNTEPIPFEDGMRIHAGGSVSTWGFRNNRGERK